MFFFDQILIFCLDSIIFLGYIIVKFGLIRFLSNISLKNEVNLNFVNIIVKFRLIHSDYYDLK